MLDDFLKLKKYFSLAHHVRGRIRLKLTPNVVPEPVNKKLNAIETTLSGVMGARINPTSRSIVVRYNPEIIPSQDLEILMTTKNATTAKGIWQRYQNKENMTKNIIDC